MLLAFKQNMPWQQDIYSTRVTIIILFAFLLEGFIIWYNWKATSHTSQSLAPLKPTTIPYSTLPTATKTTKPSIHLAVDAPHLKAPNNLYQKTDLIGSVEHPTIDGGIINAADGIVVQHVTAPTSALPVHLVPAETNSGTIKNHESPIISNDSWINNKTVTKALEKAAKTGQLNYVLQKTHLLNLPASLALVPIVESDYKNQAVSNKGAAGAWQLMPELAKDYGLADQARFQFEPATDVALRFLKELHQQFGNWELALAAYNAGPGRVSKALKQNPKASTVQELSLPRETKLYVAHIKAAHQIILNTTQETSR